MTRAAAALVLLLASVCVIFAPRPPACGTPVVPGAHFTELERDQAVTRGARFLYQVSRDPAAFREFGFDLVGTFAGIATTSANEDLRNLAGRMGQERAREWLRLHPGVPAGASANDLIELVCGAQSCERLGFDTSVLRQQLLRSASRFGAEAFLEFDPAREPPPSDLPEDCGRCGRANRRGARVCAHCGAPLEWRSRYELWLDAMITTYTGDSYGVRLGAPYAAVQRWLPQMRPYRGREQGANAEYFDTVYAVTHLVYTLNGYSARQLSPACLPQEYQFLRANLREAIGARDAESLGEYLDTLRSFGLTNSDPGIGAGVEYLLAAQNPDGSWGAMTQRDLYTRYHTTWTAIDGLREYRWQGLAPCGTP
jgi:ribosomal protein L37E